MGDFTPWQRMKAYEQQNRKIEDHWFNIAREKKKCEPIEDNVIYATMDECACVPYTYYNNGKTNCCCKSPYEYNYTYCEGYDQHTRRCDRKHPIPYLHIDLEEEYPYRTVPILTSSNYGHRPRIDSMCPTPKINEIRHFYRWNGVKPCIDANGYQTVKLNPTWPFKYNQSFGYTYSPPIN